MKFGKFPGCQDTRVIYPELAYKLYSFISFCKMEKHIDNQPADCLLGQVQWKSTWALVSELCSHSGFLTSRLIVADAVMCCSDLYSGLKTLFPSAVASAEDYV